MANGYFHWFPNVGRRKGISYIAVLAVFGTVFAFLMLAAAWKGGGAFAPKSIQMESRQIAADIRAAVVFTDETIVGVKRIPASSKYTITLTPTDVVVHCTGILCTRSRYTISVAHTAHPSSIQETTIRSAEVLCVVKKKTTSGTKITLCNAQDTSCCEVD